MDMEHHAGLHTGLQFSDREGKLELRDQEYARMGHKFLCSMSSCSAISARCISAHRGVSGRGQLPMCLSFSASFGGGAITAVG